MRVALITVNTAVYKNEEEDAAGILLKEILEEDNIEVVFSKALPSDREVLSKVMQRIADSDMADLILTTGGAGCGPEDFTPEATMDITDRMLWGIPEAMRAYTLQKTKRAMLSRGVAGIRTETLIVNLPGKAKAAASVLKYLLPTLTHAVGVIRQAD
ncbi:molybdopterin adenylyltransferase [Aequitasia blattaphilus]|uniref:MogA/MoaB family molybdenum cofactor biosynthesis protein n=1 Tax=Aequitasia blattaphilus TaxID=2949332 RepID=A0ABT1E755_9FIRM|nr:MogA/MoaB family molybdenum cofactor biosynthesis protein [Aequitasia blattaphilus]MCP1101546.1 MogA/MoaB family molybdenum cofactor biosynthesis protein [Aequitasia blattaphilus]MCR8614186.1 MogA/MoaB family molybdenum cofactor biosynthesis protein [Aequitasia blattaphilus]